jgi:hypothetical protein
MQETKHIRFTTEYHYKITSESHAGRQVWRYLVTDATTNEPIASGWCETEALAHKMAEKMKPENNR